MLITSDQVTIHHLRNCDYRTETDFDVRHYDKTFNLENLRTVDLFLVTWGSRYIAHAMVSFGLWRGLRSFADSGLVPLIVVVVAVFGAGGLVYLCAAMLLRVEELSVVNLLLRRGPRRPVPPEETEALP